MKHKYSPETIRKKRWKIGLFAFAAVVVVSLIAYSILTSQTESNSAVTASTNTPSTPDIGKLNWVKNLGPRFNDHDFIFIMLPGNNNESNGNTEKAITMASQTIQTSGINIDTVMLKQDDPEVQTTIQLLALPQLPAVIAFHKSGAGTSVVGDITETQLLQAFLAVTKACATGSGCCP